MKRVIIAILKKIMGEENYTVWRLKKNEEEIRQKINKEIKEDWKDKSLCFDIGANIGNYSMAYSYFFKKVVAFEPQEKCFNILKKRFSDKKNIILEKKAIGKTTGLEKIKIYNETTISSMSSQPPSIERFKKKIKLQKIETVEVETISKMISKYGKPDFIKIDVEGYEYEVIGGLNEPISYIQFECNWPENKKMLHDCLKHITNLGNYSINFDSIEANSATEFIEKSEQLFHENVLSMDVLCSIKK